MIEGDLTKEVLLTPVRNSEGFRSSVAGFKDQMYFLTLQKDICSYLHVCVHAVLGIEPRA